MVHISMPGVRVYMSGVRVYLPGIGYTQGVRSERRTHGGNKCKHTRARDVTCDNLAKNSL